MLPAVLVLLSLSAVQAASLGNRYSRQLDAIDSIDPEMAATVWRHRKVKPVESVATACTPSIVAVEEPGQVEEPIAEQDAPATTRLRKSPKSTVSATANEGPSTDAGAIPIANSTSEDKGAILDAPSDCPCGYVLSAEDDAYFPLHKTFDFSQITSNSALKAAGWNIETGGIGGNHDGNQCIGSEGNIRYSDGAMSLVVPAGKFSGAELVYKDAVLGGMFTLDAQIDSTVGTCQSIFTYAADGDQHGDEQDIEILGADLATNGIELTNWDPSSPMSAENRKSSFAGPNMPGADLSSAFHTYTIGWLPDKTTYSFDGKPLKAPSGLGSVNPSNVRINHWTNGDPGFTKGPPTQDTVFKIRRIEMYYTTGSGLPSGFTEAKACKV